MLFQITDPRTKRTHYLLGTMHLGNKEAYSFIQPTMQVLRQCTAYAGEMNLDEAAISDISASYPLPDQQTLRDWMSERHFRRLSRILKKAYKIDLTSMAQLRPMLITNLMAARILSKDNRPPLDQYLWEEAKALGLDLYGVESVEDQRRILESVPIKIQVRALQKSCRQVSSYVQYVHKLSKTYASGDIHRLFKFTRKHMGGIRKLMIHNRNDFMLERSLELMSNEECILIAVGAGHLGGNSGIRAGLLRAGFQVKPYSSTKN
jgi:uncharacterized protein YbaP (TraB family)